MRIFNKLLMVLILFYVPTCVANDEVGDDTHCQNEATQLKKWIESVREINKKTVWGMDDFAHKCNLMGIGKELEVPSRGYYVLINKKEIIVDGDTSNDIKRSFNSFQLKLQKEPAIVKMYVDSSGLWGDVVRVTESLRQSKKIKMAFVFDYDDAEIPIPGKSDLETRIRLEEKKINEQKGHIVYLRRMSSDMKQMLKECPSVLEQMERYFRDNPILSSVTLAKRFSKALLGCNCKIEKEIIQSILWRYLFVGDHKNPKQRVVKILYISPVNERPDKYISHPECSTWSEVYNSIIKSDVNKGTVLLKAKKCLK